MPRRHKNKYHARVKCHRSRETLTSQEAQTSAAAPEEGFSSSSPASGDHQELQGAMAPSSPDAGPFCTGSDEGAQGPEEESVGASQAAPATQITRKDPPTPKASMLVGFLLDKYPKQQPLTQNTLLKVIGGHALPLTQRDLAYEQLLSTSAVLKAEGIPDCDRRHGTLREAETSF
ncbi:hypothetical protein Celaphus_00010050 [Cervus elaphus hippelaphus]|uniref:Melanoma associated antigen N-terminal domain-containing protein n=1 Tax=Cervus elaphus hippelaphus TaxID=46360 RepID=A0A212BZU5_CEREH|nr:hypothetical protein Celaphus_00010050 [Cervus elaphus hippelaphus]